MSVSSPGVLKLVIPAPRHVGRLAVDASTRLRSACPIPAHHRAKLIGTFNISAFLQDSSSTASATAPRCSHGNSLAVRYLAKPSTRLSTWRSPSTTTSPPHAFDLRLNASAPVARRLIQQFLMIRNSQASRRAPGGFTMMTA